MAKKLEKKGVPAYMLTLADMWSLLLIFFIMLFSMSQIDATKFKKLQGSVKTTFGYNQTRIAYGPPPGFSLIEGKASADNAGTDIIVEQSASTSIIDPQLAAIKIQACERQMKKEANDAAIAKRSANLIKKVLEAELSAGLFSIHQDGRDVNLVFSATSAFATGSQMLPQMRKGLLKLGHAFGSAQGTIVIRSFIPEEYQDEFKSTYEESSLRASAIGSTLMESTKIKADRIQMGSMSSSRAPSAIKANPESIRVPFFEVSIIKD